MGYMSIFTTTWWFCWSWWSDCLCLILCDYCNGWRSNDWSYNLVLLLDGSHNHIFPSGFGFLSRWGIRWGCNTNVFSFIVPSSTTYTLTQTQIPNRFISRTWHASCVVEIWFIVRAVCHIRIYCSSEVTKPNLRFR